MCSTRHGFMCLTHISTPKLKMASTWAWRGRRERYNICFFCPCNSSFSLHCVLFLSWHFWLWCHSHPNSLGGALVSLCSWAKGMWCHLLWLNGWQEWQMPEGNCWYLSAKIWDVTAIISMNILFPFIAFLCLCCFQIILSYLSHEFLWKGKGVSFKTAKWSLRHADSIGKQPNSYDCNVFVWIGLSGRSGGDTARTSGEGVARS